MFQYVCLSSFNRLLAFSLKLLPTDNTKKRNNMKLETLMEKPIFQMSGEELFFLIREGASTSSQSPNRSGSEKYVYGIKGIADLFGCSVPTANKIKKSGQIDKAITQVGRKIIVDAELALELAGRK